MEIKLKRLAITVTGRVQGVGYRFFTKDTADMYGFSGWVHNCFNGDVEMEVQGNTELIQQFISELRKGPMMSHVTDVRTREMELESGEKLFSIRH